MSKAAAKKSDDAVDKLDLDDLSFEQLAQEAAGLRERINRFRVALGRFFVDKQPLIDLMTICAVAQEPLLLVDRLEITRAMSGTASHLSLEQAVAELRELAGQLPMITDSFNTNSHFSLSVIQFMESLILGYASEQLALGQLGRRWLDEDEYLVRRRSHRDLSAH